MSAPTHDVSTISVSDIHSHFIIYICQDSNTQTQMYMMMLKHNSIIGALIVLHARWKDA